MWRTSKAQQVIEKSKTKGGVLVLSGCWLDCHLYEKYGVKDYMIDWRNTAYVTRKKSVASLEGPVIQLFSGVKLLLSIIINNIIWLLFS